MNRCSVIAAILLIPLVIPCGPAGIQAAETVKIGVLYPLTGAAAAEGRE